MSDFKSVFTGEHHGHKIVCVNYWNYTVALECETCKVALATYKPTMSVEASSDFEGAFVISGRYGHYFIRDAVLLSEVQFEVPCMLLGDDGYVRSVGYFSIEDYICILSLVMDSSVFDLDLSI